MSYVEKHTVSLTTATGGGATAYTPPLTGRVVNIIYTRAATGYFASTADFAITAEDTALGLWTEANVNASKTVAPTQGAHTSAGVALATAAMMTRTSVHLANERVKIVIAQGGNVKDGQFQVVVA